MFKEHHKISYTDFRKISNYLENNYGIKLPDEKRTLVEGRLSKRVREMNIKSFGDYLKYLFEPKLNEQELEKVIDAITTNKTDFFREEHHFHFIENVILPRFTKQWNGQVKIWSAGSSSGQEAYSIAMLLETLKGKKMIKEYSLLGTDISGEILKTAKKAVYPEKLAEQIPFDYRKRYLLKSKNRENPTIRIVPHLRSRIEFRYHNLINSDYFKSEFNIIFCRNTLIYFNKPNQEKVLQKLRECLIPGGFLILGHSESISNLNVNLKTVEPTIYQRGY